MITLYNNMFIFACIIIGVLFYFIIDRNNVIKELRTSLNKLLHSFNELDKQAKLIVKTDLELNKTQEELDKRLEGLNALQKTSRLLSTTLDENEIFVRLNQPLLTELGFEKFIILMFDKSHQLKCLLDFGLNKDELQMTLPLFTGEPRLVGILQDKQIISSLRDQKDAPINFFKMGYIKHFVLVPILAQQKMLGMLFVGNQTDAYSVTEGDEEIISILGDQIGQAVENARLFEQVYRASQGLEQKVQERTKQLSSLLEEVQKISKTKSEFISAVSHELRTPLTSIKGYAAILLTGKVGEIPEKVKERLEKINKHSDNLVKLINDLLDISRIESGRTEMKFIKHAIPSIVENVEDLLIPQIKEKNIHFVSEIEPNLPQIFMDVNQLERVFINLIGNAIKFTPEEGTITVQIKRDNNEIKFKVSDTGIGIATEDIAKLFNEFFRVDNETNQNVKGTGLGLALVKKIIDAHKGQIWVTSTQRKGTTFHFKLPIQSDHNQE